ncbi:MAG: hypothetical protein JRH11_25820 [Deltaproteobacteria bacterium]|nr:hypothetical protein [Deltaproteobacteria bacterium]
MEPFLAVRGRLQKDGETLNVIAHEVQALRVPGTPIRRRGLARSYTSADRPRPAAVAVREGATAAPTRVPADAPARASSDASAGVPAQAAAAPSARADIESFEASLPDALEHWSDPDDQPVANPYRYLTALRQSPPGIKSFG